MTTCANYLRLRIAAIALPLALTALLGGVSAPAQAADTTTPRSLMCQGEGIDPTAQLHYQTQTFIKAPLSTVWRVHTDLAAWPDWQRAVSTMQPLTPGRLRPGSRFRWTTKVPGGVILRTEESWTGAQIEADPATAIRYLAPGLDEWLADLKARAEAEAGRR